MTIARQKAKERTIEKLRNDLDLIPDHNTETAFAERLFIPLEKRGVIKWPRAALYNKKEIRTGKPEMEGPYRANETLPTPLATKRLNSSHPVSNALLTILTLWHPQPHMTVLTIRVSLVHRESHVRIFERSVSRKAPVA